MSFHKSPAVPTTQATIHILASNALPSAIFSATSSITAAQLNELIVSAPTGSAITLQDGTYHFDAAIVVNRGDISIQGQSQAGTILDFNIAVGSQAPDFFQVNGGAKTLLSTTTSAIAVGQTSLTVADASALHAGDAIYISEPNTQAYLTANGWTNVSMADAANHPFREYIATVDHVVGSTVSLTSGVLYAMDSGVTQVSAINLLQNVNLSNFTVTNDFPIANQYDFVNPLSAYDSQASIHITGVSGGSLSNVSVLNAPSIGISLTSSIGFTGHDLSVNGAINKGGDGNGYGILLSEAFNNNFFALDLLNSRHAFIFSAWNAETGNTVQINNTNRDVNFHGSPDVGNVITVNHAVLDYNPAQDTSGLVDIWPLVAHGGTNHAYTDIFNFNQVTFHYAVGSSAVDVIYGTAGNDYLNGGAGGDTIFGGVGNDYIVGGLGKDLMSGGTGQDTFLLKQGDNLDRITDFTFGANGDTIIFAGNAALHDVSGLVITQNGADLYVRYGSNATVILSDHTLADVTAANFQYDPTGAITQAAYAGDFHLI